MRSLIEGVIHPIGDNGRTSTTPLQRRFFMSSAACTGPVPLNTDVTDDHQFAGAAAAASFA